MTHCARLSLIICTYRRPLQVQRLLGAIGSQSMPPVETLIVDSSSNDETERVVQRFQSEKKIRDLQYCRVPPEHHGLTRQRNFGIAHAEGDIIAFLDDDTIPEPRYFENIIDCFERHNEAIGVGGHITNEVQWWQANGRPRQSLSVFRSGEWERREDYRWRLRKLLGLASPLSPGWMPPSGHGRPISFLPPDEQDHKVEFIMGGASAWRSKIFQHHEFSSYFRGYGLYEDLDFCVRASHDGGLYLCTKARLAHYHDPLGRPNHFRYGEMVVRNGWFVWKRRWPIPNASDRVRWWAITTLLALCRVGDVLRGSRASVALTEAAGRLWGMTKLLWDKPGDAHGS
jgi:GT2 family glycosyltransferase